MFCRYFSKVFWQLRSSLAQESRAAVALFQLRFLLFSAQCDLNAAFLMHLQSCGHKGMNVEFKCEFIFLKYYFNLQLAAFFSFFVLVISSHALRAGRDSKAFWYPRVLLLEQDIYFTKKLKNRCINRDKNRHQSFLHGHYLLIFI